MERRRFIVKAGGALAAAGAAAVVDAPNVIAQPKVQWRMSTTWTAALDVLQGSAQQLARQVDEMSGGRFRIEVFPGGQITPQFACFDGASQGTHPGVHGRVVLLGREGAGGPMVRDRPVRHECRGRGGLVPPWRWAQALGGPLRRVQPRPAPGPSTGPQMAGWFRRKITTIGDYKGLRMRMPGLGGQVVARAGGTVVLTPASEIYAALERGVIDASEWIGPHDDMKLGLHTTARYYYYPGWHEPGTTLEFGFNKKAYEALPVDLRRILDQAAAATQMDGRSEYEAKNTVALEKLKTEFRGKVELLQLPAPLLRDLKKLAAQVVKQESEKSPMATKVYASYTKFQAQHTGWSRVSEGAYQQFVAM